MNQKNMYIFLLIFFIAIIGYLVFMNIKINEPFDVVSQIYRCDDTRGCVVDPRGEFGSQGECIEGCKFIYNEGDEECSRKPSGPVGSETEYPTKYQCDYRYECDEDAGRCIIKPGGTYDTLRDCNEACKWIRSETGNVCIRKPEDYAGDNIYDTKNKCHNRYICRNGKCIRLAGANEDDDVKVYSRLRHCESNCILDMYDELSPRMYFSFDKQLNIAETYLDRFKEYLKSPIIHRGIEVSRNQIAGIEISEEEAVVIFLKELRNTSNLQKTFERLSNENLKIIVNFEEYNLISISYNGVNNMTITAPVFTRSDELIFLEIKNTRNSYSLNTLNYSSLNLDNSNEDESLTKIQQNSRFKRVTVTLPKTIFINKSSHAEENEFYFETGDETSRYIKIRALRNNDTHNDLEKIRLQGYLDYPMIKSVYDNHKIENKDNIHLVIIGEKEPNDFFTYYNEFYLLLYSTQEGQGGNTQLKYKQINVDLDTMKLIKPAEQKKINTFTPKPHSIFEMNHDDYSNFISAQEQLSGKQIRSSPTTSERGTIGGSEITKNFTPLLFDNYYPGLRFKFTLSIRKDSETKDVLPYTEDNQPAPNEIVCSFVPSGETIFDCKELCTTDMENNNCTEEQCSEKCNNCGTLACRWNVTDYNINKTLKPAESRIKCFSGDKAIKVTWIKPLSMFPIDKYYITLSNSNTKMLNVYKYDTPSEMNEFIITGLRNGEIYSVNLVAKNKFGVSEISNTESVIPKESTKFDTLADIKYSDYEDTIEQYYIDNNELPPGEPLNLKKRISLYEQEMVKNDLKEILVDKLVPDNNIKQYTFNIY